MDLTLQETEDRVPADVKAAVRGRLLREFASRAEEPGAGELEGRVEEALLAGGYLWPRRVVRALAGELSDELFGLGPLERLLRDPEISEIMVNGPDSVYVEKQGLLEQVDLSLGDDSRVLELIRRIIGPLNLRLDETSPMVDARLPDGSRLNAVIPPLSLNGPTVTIRRFRARPFTVGELVEMGVLTPEIASFIQQAVAARANIIVSGGTSSGKTTLLNVLSSFIPRSERLITIEDAAELKIEHSHVVSLESRPANIEGRGEVTVRDLVRNALRMRPDRIIVGEVRGAEALDMLQAMNTGHPGSLSTAHANSPRDLLSRLETMVLMSDIDLDLSAIRRQLGSALDLILHTERKADGRRILGRVFSVSCTSDDDYGIEQLYASTSGQLAAGGSVAGGDQS
ncbi:MAG: CpaF family protein [Actinomycetia bacterium]|nr:CpaF family protein [Actinomycetes bacterium]